MVVGLGCLQTSLVSWCSAQFRYRGGLAFVRGGVVAEGVRGAAGVQYCLLVFVYGMGGGWC